jgi:hypothetical protein
MASPDSVKLALKNVRDTKEPFTLVFSGKSSKRENGFYRPKTHEIVLHNKNFPNDNALLFTALHEYAHHIQFAERGACSVRAHTNEFWAIFHELLGQAEVKGVYKDPFNAPEFSKQEQELKSLLAQSSEVMGKIGIALVGVSSQCEKLGARFEDFVMRHLKQNPRWARVAMNAAIFIPDLPLEVGAENIKVLAGIKNNNEREAAAVALEGTLSPQQVKFARSSSNNSDDATERLKKEMRRIETTIEKLENRKKEIQRTLIDSGEIGIDDDEAVNG